MHLINRNVVVIKSKAPLLEWANLLPDTSEILSNFDVSNDCTVYLIPETFYREDAVKYIQANFKEIFEIELVSWCRDKKLWPKRRTKKMFNDWFELEVHSVVVDLLDDYIEKEEYHWAEELL